MSKKQYIIYCDESVEKGRYYSHFYGGALVQAEKRERITKILEEKRNQLNISSEMKWTKITENYRDKYIEFTECFFDLIDEGDIKIRIMFTHNRFVPKGLTEYQIDNQYFLLYYQLIKNAFGLRYCNPDQEDNVRISLYLDDIPDSDEKFEDFKEYLHSLCTYPIFKKTKL